MSPDYSFVVPVYNERDSLKELYRRLALVIDQLDGPAEIVVDDRSTDDSFELMRSLSERDRAYGWSGCRAIRAPGGNTAGLDHATGQAAIIMDADLQDPPEVALELAARWRDGYDVVYAVRDDRAGETRGKRLSATWFYRVLGRHGVRHTCRGGDFASSTAGRSTRCARCASAGATCEACLPGSDSTRPASHTRAARASPGLRSTRSEDVAICDRRHRVVSTAPLRLTLEVGFLVSVLSFVGRFAAICVKLAGLYAVPGWASIVVFLAFLGGVQLTVLGVIGEYLAHIHDEVKQRPLYLVSDVVGTSAEPERRGPARARPSRAVVTNS